MPIQSWGKSGVLAYFGLKIGYFGHVFWDIDFKFVLPTIHINIKGQTQLEANWTQFFSDFWLNIFWRPKSKIHKLSYLRNPYLRRFWKFQTNSFKNVGL